MAKSLHLFFFFFLFLLLLSFLCAESSPYEIEELSWLDDNDNDDEISMVQSRHASLRSCDFTAGKWVFDQSYPLYDPARCPYLSTAVSCSKNGRPDSDYQKWKWKPDGCTIPRYFQFPANPFLLSPLICHFILNFNFLKKKKNHNVSKGV